MLAPPGHNWGCGPRSSRAMLIHVERVVVLSRGGAARPTAALRLSELTGLPVIELPKRSWTPGPRPTPRDGGHKCKEN